jgi:thioesterase domain-containing protein
VGGAIQNLTFFVLDAWMRPVPVGLPGELYIGGVGVARGYLGRPGLSADKFVPDPFAEPGARMYRTGDRARWLEGGNLMILGRADNQVKIRGYRVELGEIEAVLRRHPEVAECLAVVREDRPGDARLVAYVVGDADAAELREHARQALPEYMVPAAFVRLASLPETSTGKFDRRSLPAPEYGGAEPAVEAPGNFAEVQLLQIWEELLGVETIGPTQSFFDAGGNSLLVLRLAALIKRRMRCDVPLGTLLAGTTVRQMAAAILEQRGGEAEAETPIVPMQPNGTKPPLFCVHPAGRHVHGYVNLTRRLGGDQPVFGIQDLHEDLSRPLAQIAAEHVQAVRAVQPEGPYYLLGWSFGGAVAYEMAAELERQGQTVAFTGLLDTLETVSGARVWAAEDTDLVAGLAYDFAQQMGRPFTLRREELQGMELDEQCERATEALVAQGVAPRALCAGWVRESFDMIRARNRSKENYVPGHVSGTVTLFRPEVETMAGEGHAAEWTEEERRTLCWSRLVGDRVQVQWIPGTHATMGTEPNVRVLAERVREALASSFPRRGEAECG